MKIGILGTGVVGETIATRLCELGHDVMIGARQLANERAARWAAHGGGRGSHGTFADAAAFGELVFNCTRGEGSVDAVRSAGDHNLRGKVLIDVSNPLDSERGLFVSGHDSLGEQIQRAVPGARVVKALNTVNAKVMVDPHRVAGDHDIFVAGNDPGAKAQVVELLAGFGWKPTQILDLGDLTGARACEAYLLLWVRLYGVVGSGDVTIHVVKPPRL
jgi:8-hydroxy-5-deazaflavin:NADPH oxidoreductase